MRALRMAGLAGSAAILLVVPGCGGGSGGGLFGGRGLFGGGATLPDTQTTGPGRESRKNLPTELQPRVRNRSSLFDLFGTRDEPNVTLEVNRYLWAAALDVLDFLPVETSDPFSGVISFGYGTPPGGGTAYRATVYVQDPAMDARSLRVAAATRSGPVSAETTRALEDAILTRARQLRIRDGRL